RDEIDGAPNRLRDDELQRPGRELRTDDGRAGDDREQRDERRPKRPRDGEVRHEQRHHRDEEQEDDVAGTGEVPAHGLGDDGEVHETPRKMSSRSATCGRTSTTSAPLVTSCRTTAAMSASLAAETTTVSPCGGRPAIRSTAAASKAPARK